jgi:hypothetical protein
MSTSPPCWSRSTCSNAWSDVGAPDHDPALDRRANVPRVRELFDVPRRIADEIQFAAITTGRSDVYRIPHPSRRADAAELLATRLPSIPGVLRGHSELGLRRYLSGSSWRLDRLSEDQERRLREHRHGPPPSGPERLSAEEGEVARVLRRDGRRARRRSPGRSARARPPRTG